MVNHYTVLVPTKDLGFWTPTASNFTVMAADFANYSLAEQLGLKRLLDSLEPDLVHFCMPQQPILYKGKTVTTFHDLTLLKTYNSDKNWLVYRLKQLIGRFVFKRVIKSNQHIITPSEFTKKELIEFTNVARDKTTVIYEAADAHNSNVEPYEHQFQKYILYVGQQSDYKNIRRLADAHQRLIKKHPDLGLLLVGSLNDSAKINKALFESKNYKNIKFTGFVSDEQLGWLYENTEAYIFPSIMEGFGLPGLEAMAYGAPVISSDATCLPEVYGDAAYYFDPNSTTDIARAIDDVLSDTKLSKDLIKKGSTQVKKYSWHKTAKQTHEVYMKALESNG